jgi:hypothetical protein
MIQISFSNVVLQLWLAILTAAAPTGDITAQGGHHGNAWQFGTGGGIIGLIILIIDIIIFCA